MDALYDLCGELEDKVRRLTDYVKDRSNPGSNANPAVIVSVPRGSSETFTGSFSSFIGEAAGGQPARNNVQLITLNTEGMYRTVCTR